MVHHAYCYETKKKPTSRKKNKHYALEKISRKPAKGRKGSATVVRDEAREAEGVNDELPVTSGK